MVLNQIDYARQNVPLRRLVTRQNVPPMAKGAILNTLAIEHVRELHKQTDD